MNEVNIVYLRSYGFIMSAVHDLHSGFFHNAAGYAHAEVNNLWHYGK